MPQTGVSLKDKVQNLAARSVLGVALLVPYEARVRGVGWIVSRLVAPLAGWRRRVRENLALVAPDLPSAEVERIARAVPDNVGRTLIEIYSGEEFIARVANSPRTGPGVEALETARAEGRPMVLLTAHMGNYDAVRGTLSRQGYPMAALYKPMRNAAFNDHYVRAISTIAEPVYPTDGRGITALVKTLKDGGIIGIVGDVAQTGAPVLEFFDHPAHTPLSAADWALKYGAVLIPVYGLRQPDGVSFEIHVDTPIPASDPETMMQAYNDSVERVARDHMDQWFWIHRRWKTRAPAPVT